MKKSLALLCALLLCVSLTGCRRQSLLTRYNGLIELAGDLELTNSLFLAGRREFGPDHYSGFYHADYRRETATETLFGGTSLDPADGRALEMTCTLRVMDGAARVFRLCGDGAPQTLLETDGSWSGELTLPAGQNYIGIECWGFTGTVTVEIV